MPPAPKARRRVPHRLIGAGAGVIALLVAVFVAFAATSNQAVDPIAQAADVSANTPGYRMNMSFTITSPQLGAPISASANAVIDAADHAASMSLVMQAPQAAQALGTSTMQMALILEGQDAYVRFPQSMVNQLPSLGGKPWVEINVAKAAGLPGLSTIGDDPTTSDPAETLQELRAGADSVTDVGQQQVDGVQTTHYRAEINLDRLLPNLPSAERSLLQKLIQGQGIPVDVWVDAHHLVRRVEMFLAISVGNSASVQESVTADFSDYGPQPRPTPPPADQVTDGNNLVAGLSS